MTAEQKRDKAPIDLAIPRVDLRTILGDSREIVIRHHDQEYRLRLTSNDKLLLTK